MALFCIVREREDGERCVMIRENSALIFARLWASIDGFGGTLVEAHKLDAPTAKRMRAR